MLNPSHRKAVFHYRRKPKLRKARKIRQRPDEPGLRYSDANFLSQFDGAEFVRSKFDRGVRGHRQRAETGKTFALGGKRAQRPIGEGNNEIDLIDSHELEDGLYKRLRLAGRDGIIKSLAAVAR